MKQTTSNSYRHRLTKVIDYIYQNLDQDLDVNTLADIALMSPYHFHRIYREMAQETINASVRRLRLQRAAAELIRSSKPVSDIAKSISYQSTEAFSRAFTKHFGQTPKEYRELKQSRPLEREPFIAMLPTQPKASTIMYDVEIIEMDKIDLAGYPHQGDYMEIGQVFEKIFIYGNTNKLLDEKTRTIGLYYDDPCSVPKEQLRSVACISINQSSRLEGEDAPKTFTIPAGKYATILFKGPYAELEKPYNWLFGEWLPNSGYEADNFPPAEEYLNDPKTTAPNELLTRIYCLLK